MPCLQMHHVLYEDGENEWMCLAKEAHAWVPTLPGRAYPAGLPPGEACILMKLALHLMHELVPALLCQSCRRCLQSSC